MTQEQYDAIIVGAGFSGIYQLIQMRKVGLRCTVIEAGSDLGGTWYWNRYPGARADSPIPIYELPLPELWKDWTWTEKLPGWRELQAYFAYVGDKMNVHPYCRFNTVVKQAHWDDRLHLWNVTAEGKDGVYKASARHLFPCIGLSSKPYIPDIKGRETFKGPCPHTTRWPKEGIEMAGKRVGVIGTGGSGVQVIEEIGPQVAHLTVFQRTPNQALPRRQHSISREAQNLFKHIYGEMYKKLESTLTGGPDDFIRRPMLSDSKEEREANFERLWAMGGFYFLLGNYYDLFSNREGNKIAYDFWRKKVAERIKDPEKRALLAPEVPRHPLASKSHSLEDNYYEVFNQDNVDLVDLNATPILEITENGLKTTDKEYQFDVLIFATGFDGYIGGFNEIDLRGLNGETIQEHWKDGVLTYLGMTIDNFPNLFFMFGPQGPSTLSNAPICVHVQGMWILQTIKYLREYQITKFTPITRAALTFKEHVNELCAATFYSKTDNWYMGANIPGKKREAYTYHGGLVKYTEKIKEEIERGYPGFLRETLTESIV